MDLKSYTDNIYEKIVQQIRTVRKEKDIQQKQIAEALGMNQVSYSDAESGKTRFTVTRLFAAVKYLGIDLAPIFEEAQLLKIQRPNPENIHKETLQVAESAPNPIPSLQDDLHHLLKAILIQNNMIQEMKEQNKSLYEQNQELKQDLQEIRQLLTKLLSQPT